MKGKRVIQAVATWVRPPPNPQAIRSPFPFFLDLLPRVASLLPCSISFILSCPAGQIGSFLAGSKKRTINFSALHTNHEGSLLRTNIFLSPCILSKRDVSLQNVIGVSGEAQVEAN